MRNTIGSGGDGQGTGDPIFPSDREGSGPATSEELALEEVASIPAKQYGEARHPWIGAVELSSRPAGISYRVVEDFFGDSGDTERLIDVVIQTTDPDDFADFAEAVEEAMDRLQERIDLAEMTEHPDRAHLDLLEEKFGDTGEALGADWDTYTYVISQPCAYTDDKEINLAEVEGRERFARLMESGYSFPEWKIECYNRLSRQAECGTGTPRIKPKALKPRPRPELDFAKVKIDPILAAAYGPDLILGFLIKHRNSFISHPDWKPHRDGFVSDLARPEAPDSYIHVLTVFLDGSGCVTSAVAVPMGQLPPDDFEVMDRSTVWLDPILSPEIN